MWRILLAILALWLLSPHRAHADAAATQTAAAAATQTAAGFTPTPTRTPTNTPTPTETPAKLIGLMLWHQLCPTPPCTSSDVFPDRGQQAADLGGGRKTVWARTYAGQATVQVLGRVSGTDGPETLLGTLTGASCDNTASNCAVELTAWTDDLYTRITACAPLPTPTGTPAAVGASCEVSTGIRQERNDLP